LRAPISDNGSSSVSTDVASSTVSPATRSSARTSQIVASPSGVPFVRSSVPGSSTRTSNRTRGEPALPK